MAPPPTRRCTILFADIAGSSRLYDTFGAFKARELIAACLSCLKTLVGENGGTVIKTIGDEILCTFPTANQAADAARLMHEAIAYDTEMVQANIRLHIGMHHGEVICEPQDVFGDAVNVAARLVDLAKSDQIITDKATLALMKQALRRRARLVDRTRIPGTDGIMEIHELIWGKPEQLTMSNTFTEKMIASLTSEKDFLQIRYRRNRILVDHERPILTMGRGIANHLLIEDPMVSRVHARIELQRSRFMLIDQSTNGTYVQPTPGESQWLRRDSMQIEGRGWVGLGRKMAEGDPRVIHYRVL